MSIRSVSMVVLLAAAASLTHSLQAQDTTTAPAQTSQAPNSVVESPGGENSDHANVVVRVLKAAGLLRLDANEDLVGKLIDETIDQAREDQDLVHAAIRRVNINIDRFLANKTPSECARARTPQAPSAQLLQSRYIRRHPELVLEWASRPWVLNHPVVIAHPEVLSYQAVKAQPQILDYVGAMHYPSLLDSPPVRREPSLLLSRYDNREAGLSGGTGAVAATELDACDLFAHEIRRFNEYLLIESYGDSIRQNSNLSRQLSTRLETLVKSSETLSTRVGRDRFLQEYTLLMDRFLESKQFRAGFGAVYSYLPTVRYNAAERVDLSAFRSEPLGGADRLAFGADFTNQGFVSLLLSAKTPFFDIDLLYPNFESTTETISAVQFSERDATGTQILSRSTVNSTLKIEYDAGIRVGLGRLLERRRTRTSLKLKNELGPYYPKSSRGRFDWGLGVGVTGFRVENSINTDVRLRNDETSVFNDLASFGTLPSSNRSTFESVYLTAFYKFRVSDELEVGIDYRRHDKDQDDGGRIVLGGETMQLTLAFYPTLGRKQSDLSRFQESLEQTVRKNTEPASTSDAD